MEYRRRYMRLTEYIFRILWAGKIVKSKGLPLLLILLIHSALVASTLNVQVSDGADDAEERVSDGAMYLESSDLELINDDDYQEDDQVVGIRFQNITIPAGSTITTAYIQFTGLNPDEDNTNSADLTIKGEKSTDSTAFSTTDHDISNRTTTSASVSSWQPSNWSDGDRGADQQTPELKSIVQEIIDQSGWSSGNAMTFVITGSGSVSASSYDGSSSDAPILHVEYTAPVTISDATITLEQNSNNGALVYDVNDATTRTDTDDSGNNISYSITAGNDDGTFTIDSATGEITVSDNSQLSSGSQYTLTIKATADSDSDTATIMINIINGPIWSYHIDQKNSGQSNYDGPLNEKIKWNITLNDDIDTASPAIGSDGTIYIGTTGKKFYALNPSDGSEKWHVDLDNDIVSAPAIGSDGTIYVGTKNERFYALNPSDGSEKWYTDLNDDIDTASPAIGSDGTIYIGTTGKKFYALNPSDGSEKWHVDLDNDIVSAPAIGSDGTIYVGTKNERFYALNPSDGSEKWHKDLQENIDIASPIVGKNGIIYIGTQKGYIYAIDSDGTTVWSYKTSDDIKSFPAIGSDGSLYVGSKNKNFYAFYTPPPTRIADYHFDACHWDGTAGEVKDSSGNSNDANTENNASTIGGKINKAANLAESHYLELENPIALEEWSISVWIQFPLDPTGKSGDRYYYVLGSVEGDGDLAYFTHKKGESDITWGVYDNNKKVKSQDFPDDLVGWHHITLTNNKSVTKLYIDSSYYNEVSTYTTGNFKIIGSSTDNLDEQTIGTSLDEFKIFDNILAASEIQKIYENESAERNYDGSAREVRFCPNDLQADYRFDTCQWNDTEGKVKDNSGHDNNGTAQNGIITSKGKVNHAALLDGTDDYIDMGDVLDPGSNQHVSISAWFMWDGTDAGSEQDILSKESIFMAKVQDNKLQYAISPHWNWDGGDSFPVNANEWTHVVITYDGAKQRLYKNGSLVYERDQTGDIGGNEYHFTVGAWKGTDSVENFFHGKIDELKVFDDTLTSAQIKALYDNESAHKNYDGSHRMAVDCTTPELLAEYRFDACKYTGATGEVIDSAGGHNGTINGDVNISKDEKKIGHAVHLNTGGVDIDNIPISTDQYKKNTVTFWMYWDETDKGRIPFGWTTYDLRLSKKGYFGFNARNSLIYGIDSSGLKNGWHFVTAIFTNGDVESNRLYIDGVLQSISQKKGTLVNANAYASTSARIGGWRNNDSYRFIGYLDELKIYKGELNATTIASIYNSEKDLVRDIICAQPLFNAVNRNGGCFHWDNNITTKVAGEDINLTILSADANDNNSSLGDINITKVELLSFSDAACDTLYNTTEIWNGNQKVDDNGCFNPDTFIHHRAVRCAKIRISGIYEGENVESNSTDTFSIRPKTFILQNLPTGKLTAEHPYTFKAVAVNADGTTATADYNTSVTPQAHKYFRDGSDGSAMVGSFSPATDFSFADGTSADTNLNFDNVGIVGLELNDTAWTVVDSDDTPLTDRTIYLEQNLTFIPDHFRIIFSTTPTMENNATHFTYLSNDLNMSARLRNLSLTITAEGEKNGTMTNYAQPQTKYFANPVDIVPALSIPGDENTSTLPQPQSEQNLSFSAGVANMSYADVHFNYDRNHSDPTDPFSISGSDTNFTIGITDHVDTSVEGNETTHFDGSATFYYGRVLTSDLRTSTTPTAHNIRFAVYATTLLPGFEQYTQNWYINKYDDVSNWLAIDPKVSRKLDSDNQNSTTVSDVNITSAGVKNFNVNASGGEKFRAFYHLDIPTWLWYSRYEAYSHATDSTCAEHPCFTYIFDAVQDDTGIKSGDYKGVSFGNDFNSSVRRKAVKILR